MVSRYWLRLGQWQRLPIGQRERISGFAPLPALMIHGLTSTKGRGMASVEIHNRKVKVRPVLSQDSRATAHKVSAKTPFSVMVVNELPAQHSGGEKYANGQEPPLHTALHLIENGVHDLTQRGCRGKSPFGQGYVRNYLHSYGVLVKYLYIGYGI